MDRTFMQMALDLAIKAKGRTSPNPMVGAVIVHHREIVGTGYHQKAGTMHAEKIAIQNAGKKAFGATLYVTLEPCCHVGKTGPCTDVIIQSGIQKVVLAMEDPNPLVAGKGIVQLKEAGIEVVSNILHDDAQRLNEAYVKFIRTSKPFVALKSAMSLDGKIATSTGQSQWITGEASRKYVHQLRDTYDAVLVGIDTVLKDDPRLTVRIPGFSGRNPLRIIMDSHLRLPLSSAIVQTALTVKTMVATTSSACSKKARQLVAHGIEVVAAGHTSKVDVDCLLRILAQDFKVTSLLVEGGSKVHASFLSMGAVDKIYWMMAPMFIGGANSKGSVASMGVKNLQQAIRFEIDHLDQLDEDILMVGYPMKASV